MRELAAMIKVGYHGPGNLSELQAIQPSIGDIFVLDNLCDMSYETHQLLFMARSIGPPLRPN